ncbi:MAG: hypothetical protein WD036_02240 [Bauldia sp.]
MKSGKVWGTTEPLLVTPLVQVHRLSILPYSRCSLHVHRFKWNAFFVWSGKLIIEVHREDYDLVDITELSPGELATVRPGEYHRFASDTDPVEAIEVYYTEALSEDIVRKDVGSREPPDA